ncbi:MAG: AmmeMemoRadiSam system protein B [Candidatus Zipacnadales bacterium]
MRPTAAAGPPGYGFYVDDAEQLRTQITRYLDQAHVPDLAGDLVAVMVPHAGYAYSGPVAAYAYKALRGKPYRTAIILGNSHRAYFRGAALSPDEWWDSPLGPVEVDRTITEQLIAKGDPFIVSRAAHAEEHSLEVQVPFLQMVLPGIRIVPLLLADATEDDCRKVAAALAPIVERNEVVLVTSSDMAHYPQYDAACGADRAMLEAIATLDIERLYRKDRELMAKNIPNLHCTLCGLDAVATTIMVANTLGVTEAKTLKYANSGDTAGDKSRCVGYGAVAFLRPSQKTASVKVDEDNVPLSDDEKRRLLKVARQTLEAHYGLAEKPSLDPEGNEALAKPTACFVTLKRQGRLRGCIGELEPRQPLIEAVANRAIAAAESDPRFRPVEAAELPLITIEISAMSPLRRVDSYEEIIVGKHGVVVEQGGRSGVFLPQVAPERGWDRDTMLSILCTEKAGLPADAWKHGAALWVFTANVFSEEEFGLAPPTALK